MLGIGLAGGERHDTLVEVEPVEVVVGVFCLVEPVDEYFSSDCGACDGWLVAHDYGGDEKV